MNSYLLEKSFDDFFEKNWERIYSNFVDAVHNGVPFGLGRSERIIPDNIAKDMLSAFFIMLCRNPSFDAMGIYKKIKDYILYPVFESLTKAADDKDNTKLCVENEASKDDDQNIVNSKECIDELMMGIWYSELYKIFFRSTGGFYHNVVKTALTGCQMVLIEAYDGAGEFITSDNPAFEHISVVDRINNRSMIFPISPKYLIVIAKGESGINIVDHRFANSDTIRYFNRIIVRYKIDNFISNQKDISKLI